MTLNLAMPLMMKQNQLIFLSEVFGAEIQDDGAQIDGTSGGSNNLAGVMVSYNTLDKEDSDLFHTGGNDSMPILNIQPGVSGP